MEQVAAVHIGQRKPEGGTPAAATTTARPRGRGRPATHDYGTPAKAGARAATLLIIAAV